LKSNKRLGVTLGVLGAAACTLALFYTLDRSSKINDQISYSQAVYSESGELLRLTLSGDEKYRIETPLETVNPKYVEATLLLEDKYFYQHFGINPISLLKAGIGYGLGLSHHGASTITMQVARLHYRLRTRTPWGKFIQSLYAMKIELTHSKKEILEAYLNLIPFGGNLEGVGSASLIYFDKNPKNLNLSEILSLITVPQSPKKRQADIAMKVTDASSPKKALVDKWIAAHPEDKNLVLNLRLPLRSQTSKALPFEAPHFTNFVIKNSNQSNIHTSLDLNLQKNLEKKVSQYISSHKKIGLKNAAVLVVNHRTSEIKAYLGSNSFFDEHIQGQVDGIQAQRSPGSALKPFVYALGFDQGLIHQKTLLKDTPLMYAAYDPENFDQKFVGPISAEDALITSRNVPAVWLSQKLKAPNFYDFLKKSGVYFPKTSAHYGLSLVLGATEVSPFEMAHLYSALANHGLFKKISWLSEQSIKNTKPQRILSAESSFMTLESLTKSPRTRINSKKHWLASQTPIAWKTGTSHGSRDAWTAGVIGDYTVVVWVGNFDNTANPALIGRRAAAPLFFQIADSLNRKSRSTHWLSLHDVDLIKTEVCSVTGGIPAPSCPHTTETWFNPGHSPIAKCKVHRSIIVDHITGFRKCGTPSKKDKNLVFEFWPSDLKHLFTQAGIARQEAPSFSPNCQIEGKAALGQAPEIRSPVENIMYLTSLSSRKALNSISFEAVSDSDVKTLYWFLDKTYIGQSKPSESLSYNVERSGVFLVTVVDDLGRSDQRKISLQITN